MNPHPLKHLLFSSVLKRMVERAGASSRVTCHNLDFLAINPLDDRFSSVTHILCDPSVSEGLWDAQFSCAFTLSTCTQCSGSGMVHRQDDAIDALAGNGEPWAESDDASRRLAALV